MHPLLNSLKELSKAANEALPFLEKYDYRKEVDSNMDDCLPMEILPKPLKKIIDSILRYCIPIIKYDEVIPQNALLNKKNMQLFIENLNLTDDKSLYHQFQFIEVEPIQDVSAYFVELGLKQQATLLANAAEFAIKLRTANRSILFSSIGHNQPKITINFTVPPEELSEKEMEEAQNIKDFCSIFKTGKLAPAQKNALYATFKNLLADSEKGKPHLIITTALILMKNLPVYGKPLTGTFNSIRTTVFTSLGWPATTAKSYRETSLKEDTSPSLIKYKEQATALLTQALGNTR